MSRELIGYENLPNAFIEKIEIYDYSGDINTIKTSLVVHDLANGSIWSDTEEIFNQMMKIGIIYSFDPEEIDLLLKGQLDPLNAKNLETKNIDNSFSVDNSKIYNFDFKKNININVENLYIFSFCFIDKKQILEKMKIVVDKNYVGPLKCEKVVQNRSINTISYLYQRQNGEYWPGPVHQHEGVFMIGSYHTPTPHEALTRIMVDNTKLKDLRGVFGTLTEQDKSRVNYISDLFISTNNNTDVNSVFMINAASILKQKSVYKKFLVRAQRKVIEQIVSGFKIKSLSIVRQRVKKDRLKVKKIYNQKNILTSYDADGILQKITRFEKDGEHDIILENLRSKEQGDNFSSKEIFIEQLPSFKKIASIKEVFLDYGFGIRAFKFSDYELSENTFGEYQYKISLYMSDPTRDFIARAENELSTIKSDLKRAIVLFKRKKIDDIDLDFQYTINKYIEIYSYIYDLDTNKRKKIRFQMKNMLNLSSTTQVAMNKVYKMFDELHLEMNSFFRFDKKKRDRDKKVSIASKEPTIATIYIENTFNDSFVPSNNQVSFSYMEDNKSDYVKVITKDKMKERANEEVNKNFQGPPKLKTPSVPKRVERGLRDLRTFRTAYLSPRELKDAGLSIDLRNNFNVPFNMFNKSFNKTVKPRIPPRSFNIKKPPASTQEFIEDDGKQFVEASKALGRESEFVKYPDSIGDLNIIEDTLAAEKNIVNNLFNLDKPRQVPDVFKDVKKINTQAEAVSLPCQIKSVLNSLNSSTQVNYITKKKDILSKAETSSYFEVNNFSLQTVVFLKGFRIDDNLNVSLNKPIFSILTQSELDNINSPVLCMMKRYTNNKFKIADDQPINISNSVFIISDQNINNGQILQTSQEFSVLLDSFSYQFLNSEVVTQNNQPVSYSATGLQTITTTTTSGGSSGNY